VLFKLITGDEVAVHAATATTAQINRMIKAGYNGLRRAGDVDFVMAQKWGSVWAVHSHY
jgi:hypothetical protein